MPDTWYDRMNDFSFETEQFEVIPKIVRPSKLAVVKYFFRRTGLILLTVVIFGFIVGSSLAVIVSVLFPAP